MNRNTLYAHILPALLGGTSRHPLPEQGIASTELLSLMGQALRFERPPAPGAFVVEPEIRDDRTILADALRRPLLRLLAAKVATEHPARALARAFDRLRLRPHPFDLPVLDTFVRSHAEALGTTAQHWTDRQKPDAGTQSYFDPEQLDDSNWAQATPARRAAYLEQRRREDSDAARSLVESAWAQENADTRFRLLQAFQTGLSIADQPFLNSLETDRAPRVRTLAAKFLARLGAGSGNPALAACVERIKRGQSGLLRKRTTLQLELPANVKDQAVSRWILQTFQEISVAELAGAFQLNTDELLDAAAKDEPLLLALALMATNECRLDLFAKLIEHLPLAWERLFEAGLDTLGTMTGPERQRWVEILFHPYRKDPPAAYVLWDWLHRITAAAVPPSVMETILRAELLRKVLEPSFQFASWAELMAAICPASERRKLREQLTTFDPSQTVTPLALLAILDGMENQPTHV